MFFFISLLIKIKWFKIFTFFIECYEFLILKRIGSQLINKHLLVDVFLILNVNSNWINGAKIIKLDTCVCRVDQSMVVTMISNVDSRGKKRLECKK